MYEQLAVDHLTGFFSRQSLGEFLQESVIEAASDRKSILVTLVDLDHFKNFNDRFGHVFGDEILKHASEVLRSTVGETSNYFFRYGGDEFIIVSIDRKVGEVVRALRKYNAGTSYQPLLFKSRSYRITMSAGIAIFPKDAQTVEELIAKADKAMYFSKAHGRKTITLTYTMRYMVIGDVIAFLSIVISAVILIMFLWANSAVINNAASFFVSRIKTVKVRPAARPVTVPSKPAAARFDTVGLKDGASYQGRILAESADEVIIRVNSEEEEKLLNLPRSKIANIERGAKE